MKANSSKRTLWLVSLVLILALLLAVGVSGAWFTASKTGSANVTMGEAVEIELVNNGSGWDTIDDTDVLPGSDFVPKVQIKSLSLTHSIIRAKWEFSMLDGDVAVTPKTQTEIDAIADENERAYQQQVKDLFDYYAITQAANMHVKTSGVNVSDQYYIYSAADGYYYFNKVQNSTELLDFTSDTIIVPTTITNELKFHTLRLTFIAESVQILAINSENFSSTGWGEWSNLPTAIQEMIDQYNENPIASAMEDVELADFEYEVVDANSNGNYAEAEGDYILLKRYTGILRQYRVKSHYTIDTDTMLPVVDAGSTSLSTSLATTATLPVKTIGNGVDAFDDKVVNIDLPSTVDTINNSAFAGNTKLENVLVDGETALTNPGGTISTAPSASEWISGIYIGYEAFVGTNISNVTIPEGIDFTINTGAFDPNVGFTYGGTKYDTLEDLQNAMTAAGDSLTLDTSVLFTPAVGSSGGGGGSTTYYYDPTGTYSYVDSYGTWTFDIEDHTAIIRTYIPADKYNGGEITELTIPSQVTHGGNTYTVVAVGDYDSTPAYAFMPAEQYVDGEAQAHSKHLLTGSLTVPASVTKLGRSIFANSNITSLVIEGDFTASEAFKNCSNLKNIVANNLTVVSYSMFSNCEAIENVSLGKVSKVEEYAFDACTSLSDVNMPKVVEIGYTAFYNCTELSKFNSTTEGVADLHNVGIISGAPDGNHLGAFEECTSLVSVYFGSNVYIGAKAFKNCSALTNIYFATTGAASLSAENSQINVGDRDGDGNDDFITATTITDEYSYSLTGNNCNLTVNGSPAAESYAAGTTIDVTVTVDSGYIKTITYFAPVLNGEGKYELQKQTIDLRSQGVTSYTISGLVMNYGQAIEVTNEFKVTMVDGTVTYTNSYVNWNGRAAEIKNGTLLNIYKDQYGNIYYYGETYTLTHDITLTEATHEDGAKNYAYSVKYMHNDVDISSELRCDNDSGSYRYIYEHHNFALHLPTYGISNGNKYIAGWTDNNGHTYMFEEDGEYVNLDWATGDMILYPVWETAPITVTLDGGPNKLVFDNDDFYYKWDGFHLPTLNNSSFWWDYTNEVGYREYFKYNELSSYEYAFSVQLAQSSNTVYAEVDRIVGYNGTVINKNWFTFDTGYTTENSPTKSEYATIIESYIGLYSDEYYKLPDEPEPNQDYYFKGWIADRDVALYGGEIKPMGSVIGANKRIYTLESTRWTASWVKITFDTGYTESNSPTSTEHVVFSWESDYKLPKVTPNPGYRLLGWIADIDVVVGYKTEPPTKAGTVIPGSSIIITSENVNWTAVWETITFNADDITIKTGWKSEGSPTSTEVANIDYENGAVFYTLPAPPMPNEGYVFKGWVADRDVRLAAGMNIPAGTSMPVEKAKSVKISTLEPTIWSASWGTVDSTLVTVDNGFKNQNSPTNESSSLVTYYHDGSRNLYYKLPFEPAANTNYYFRGWVANRDVDLDANGIIKVNAGTVLQANIKIYTHEATHWTAVWDYIDISTISVDTGYTAENSPTSTQNASITYYDGDKYYRLPAAPAANEGYYFKGWVADRDVDGRSSGYLFSECGWIYTFEETTWTACWGVRFDLNSIVINTGWKSEDSPTSDMSADIIYRDDYYLLPSAPKANDDYYFMGWVADRDVIVGNEASNTIEKGTLIFANSYVATLEPTTWTAKWLRLTVDTGYTESNSPTTDKTSKVNYAIGGGTYYKTPALSPANGAIFGGWIADIDVVVGSTSNAPTPAGTLIPAGSVIYTLEETHWTARWKVIFIDTGYKTENSPTSTENQSVNFVENSDGDVEYYMLPNAPVPNEGYYFIGWIADRDVLYYDEIKEAGTILNEGGCIYTLDPTHWTAVWFNPNEITFDTGFTGEGGPTNDENAEVEYYEGAANYLLPNDPTANTGYIFVGWTTNKDLKVESDNNIEIVEAGTVIGKDSKSGYGYTFIHTLEPTHWTAIWFTAEDISFDTGYSEENSPTNDKEIFLSDIRDNAYVLPEGPTGTSLWEFGGWIADIDVVVGSSSNEPTKAGTLISPGLWIYTLLPTHWTAQWIEADKYTVTYDLNGGDGKFGGDGNEYTAGSDVQILSGSELTNGSLVFITWNTQPDGSGEEYKPNSSYSIYSNLHLYAQYGEAVAAEVNITYNQGDVKPEEGAVPSSHTAVVGNTIYLPNCDIKVKGYRFVGWLCNLDGNTYKAGDGYTVSNSDVEFVAQWESDAPVVTIGMLVEAPNCTVKYGQNNSDVSTMNVYSEWVSGFNADDTIYIAIFGANGEVVDANNISISGGCEGNYSKETRTENGETFVLITCWPTLSSSIFVQFSDYTWYEKYIPYWGAESTKNEQSAKISAIDSVMDGATAAFVETVYVGSDESNNWLVAFVEEGGETLVIAFVFEGSSDTLLGFIQRFEDGTYTCESMGGDEAVLTSVNNKLFQEWYTKYIPNWGTESTKTEQSAKIAAIDSVMGEGASNMLPETVYVGNDEANSWLVAILEEDGDTYVYAFVFDGTTGEPQVILNHDGTGARGDAFEGGDETLINTYCNKLFPEWYTKYIPNWGTVSTKTEQSAKMDSIAQVMEGYEEMMAETVYVGTDGTNNWLVAIVPEELEVFAFIFDEATQTLQGMIYANEDGAGHAGGDEALVGPYVDVLFPPL